MKKLVSITSLILSSFLLIGASFNNVSKKATALQDDYTPICDLKGGINLTYTSTPTSEDKVATIKVMPELQDWSGSGIFIRIKNNTSINTPITFTINDTTPTHAPASLVANCVAYSYDANGGNKQEIVQNNRGWGTYIMLEQNFDGIYYFPYTSFVGEFTPNSMYAMYFGVSTGYDSYADYTIGDIFTDTNSIVDTSSLSSEQFDNIFVPDTDGSFVNIKRAPNEKDFDPEGKDLKGGAIITVNTKPAGDTTSEVAIFLNAKNFSDGIYIRVKNNENVSRFTMMFVNGTNNHRVKLKTNSTYYSYDLTAENKQVLSTREFGSYFTIPASFDGFLYFPLDVFESDSTWGGNASTPNMLWNELYAIYLGINAFYDTDYNVTYGDVFGIDMGFDGSEYTKEDFSSHVSAVVSGELLTITQAPGYFVPETPEHDYSKANYQGEIDGGVYPRFNMPQTDVLSSFKIKPNIKDHSDAFAFVIRVKNISGDYPMQIKIVDEDGNTDSLEDQKNADIHSKVKLVNLDKNITNAPVGGNPVSIKVTTGFDGFIVLPLAALIDNGSNLNLAKISYFEISVAVFYDSLFDNAFGEIGFIKENDEFTKTLDLSKVSFEGAFEKDSSDNFVTLTKYQIERPCSWVGDVKVLDSMNYASTEEMKKSITWDPGDNACTYYQEGDGVHVDIGPYEDGHAYGSYMALGLFNRNQDKTDRTDWTHLSDGTEKYAQGISIYLKNLSSREIGINIQFDEIAGETAERWLVKKYPAMYYAYDVVEDVQYTLLSKSDQIQIPVGFEGYVRIPFSQFSVPDWCHGDAFSGTDDILDISKVSGDFFITSDNTRFEDLSFFMKELGVYFNETYSASAFNTENTIKTHMGL